MSTLSDLWTALQGVSSNIENFFSGIATAISGISNTGQGIFSGLAAYGSSIWTGMQAIATSIENAFKYVADTIGTWFNEAWVYMSNAFGNAIQTVGTNLYNVGNWIWSGMAYIGQSVLSGLKSFYDWFVSTFNGMWTFLTNAFGALPNQVNSYFNGVVNGWRGKIRTTLMADMALNFGWDGISSAVNNFHKVRNLEDALGSFGSVIFAPIAGALGGYFLGALLDMLLPNTGANISLIPAFNFMPPAVSSPNILIPSGYGTPTGSGSIVSLTGIVESSLESVTSSNTSEEIGESSAESITRYDSTSEGIGEVSVEGLNASSP